MNKRMKTTAIGLTAVMALTAFSGAAFAENTSKDTEVPEFVTEKTENLDEDEILRGIFEELGVDEADVNHECEMPEDVEFTESGEIQLDDGFSLQTVIELLSVLTDPDLRTEYTAALLEQTGAALSEEEMAELLTAVHDFNPASFCESFAETVTSPEFLEELKDAAIEAAAELIDEKCDEIGTALINITADDIKGMFEKF